MIPFIDLKAQRTAIGPRMNEAIDRVLEHGAYIMGPEVRDFEAKLAAFSGVEHVVSCGNGTDALQLALMAAGIGPGDAVFVPSFTFAATAEAVAVVGATPVFVDVRANTFNMCADSLQAAVDATAKTDLRLAAVMPVDLFGLPADYATITPIAKAAGMIVIADAAQACGATRDGVTVGGMADMTTTSFFPAKPLGCYGDGGAVMSNDATLADKLRSLRVHGKGTDKYDNVVIGLNSRLDTLQAAILLEKLAVFAGELTARQQVAERYAAGIGDVVTVPVLPDGYSSAWAQYTVRVENRDAFQAALKDRDVPSAVYYAKPLHQQTAYGDYPVAPGGLPVTDGLAGDVVSLPMHPYLEAQTQQTIIDAVRAAV